MTEQEFNEEVKAVIKELDIPETYAEYVVIKDFLRGWNEFKIADHIARRENSEHYKFAERLKRTAESQLTKEDLGEGKRLINKDFTTGGWRRGELNYLSAVTSPEKSIFHPAINTIASESSDGVDTQQQRIELLTKKIAEMFDCSEERAAGIVKEALAQRNIDQTLDSMFDNISEFQEIGVINGMPPKLIPPASDVMWINLVDPVTGEPIKKEDLVKASHNVDLEEAYPGTRKTNPELYSEPFVADYRKMYPTKPSDGPQPLTEDFDPEAFHQMYALKSSLTIPDKWFFYRNHQFHDVHHKRRKAHFDEITLILLRHGWTQYKETLHKKKYHIFDKTPRAKAERLALKRSREKIKSTLMIS